MAKVTITLEDMDGNDVSLKLEADPAFPEDGSFTKAHMLAMAVMRAVESIGRATVVSAEYTKDRLDSTPSGSQG